MMKLYSLLLLLANVLIFLSNAGLCLFAYTYWKCNNNNTITITIQTDYCVEGSGSTNIEFYGNYIEKVDSDGKTYYEEDSICGDQFLYEMYDRWVMSGTLWGASYNIYCDTENVAQPPGCDNWEGADSVTVTRRDCSGM